MIRFELSSEDAELIGYWTQVNNNPLASTGRPIQTRPTCLLDRDMWLGLAGELVLSRYLTGDIEAFKASRESMRALGSGGDGGQDVPGYAVDIKTTEARTGRPAERHHLIVGRRDWRRGWTYVLGLYEDMAVSLMGYATSSEVVASFDFDETSHWIRADKLHPMPLGQEARDLWSIAS